ncbi:hypothetical protein [Acrocarpospora catenulata]|uniref:hypothetical protein n=1 Tax=Acrocarpospora catenulata TaxID=2836182 RepID=UPI001BDA580C|nr:hypothetical protein [Acrocarpospora catenulata]
MDELQQLEENLARVRKEAGQLREQIGDRTDGPTDPAELSMLISNADQLDALAEELEARRQRLLKNR